MEYRRLHFVGIGGAGMSSLAALALQRGYAVTGFDARASATTEALVRAGARLATTHGEGLGAEAEVIVVSSAMPATDPEVVWARSSGKPVLRRGELLAAWLATEPGGIAVCGTHGKGSTASALVDILCAAGHRVAFTLGAQRRADGLAAAWVESPEFFVAEVDESDRTHLAHRPAHLLITNLEADHLDAYAGIDELVASFVELARAQAARAPRGKLLVGRYGPACEALIGALRAQGIPFATSSTAFDADYTGAGSGDALVLARRGEELGRLASCLPSALDARNTVAAAAFALELGVSWEAVAAGVRRHQGLRDRFELRQPAGRPWVVTDYTSHPTCIAGNLAALRSLGPERRLVAVFHPFRYSLLGHFWKDYVDALAAADEVLVLPVDAAGEAPRAGLGQDELVAALQARGAQARGVSGLAALELELSGELGPQHSLVVFGGGPLFGLARRLAGEAPDASEGRSNDTRDER